MPFKWFKRKFMKRFDRDYGQSTASASKKEQSRRGSLGDIDHDLKAALAGEPFDNHSKSNNRSSNDYRKGSSSMNEQLAHYVALYDYDARAPQDLTIRRQDHLELLENHETWFKVRHMSTGGEGFVPANYVAEYRSLDAQGYYVGSMRRTEVDHLLLSSGNPDGCFLVRDSESKKTESPYALSIIDGGMIRHYRIKFSGDKYFINAAHRHKTVHELIEFYSEAANGLCHKLTTALSERNAPETVGLSHNTWEIPREDIQLLKRLGQGNFGEVFAGTWNGNVEIAVKTLKPGTMERDEFLAEAEFLKKLQHPNLLQLYAVCTIGEPLYIITELMKDGSLLDHLRGPGSHLPIEDLIHLATQVAFGMEYLEAENYIHRDLAARNVLVNGHTVKVADFGLSRLVNEEEYQAREGAVFPIKWTAPEAISYNKFTIKSDVWSFGVLLSEIVTHGAKPYPGMTNMEVAGRIDQGYRMPKPKNCPDLLYDIMLDTWHKDPMKRPTFTHLKNTLEDYFTLSASEYREADEV